MSKNLTSDSLLKLLPLLTSDEDSLTLEKNIVVGHTHIQFVRWHKELFFANPGSVGQPRDGDPRSAFAIYDTEKNEIKLRRVEYNIQEVYEAVIEAGLPEFLGERLFRGY